MNYDQARQLKDGGWHWTTKNDGIVRTAEPCLKHIGDESDPAWYLKPYNASDWTRCEPHSTREEAERHFYEWCIESLKEDDLWDWTGCQVCDAPTKKALGNRGMHMLITSVPLCDEHRNVDKVRELYPQPGGIALTHS